MRREKLFKNKDGSRVRVIVAIDSDSWRQKVSYTVTATKCEKHKKTWKNVVDTDGLDYRSIPFQERETYRTEKTIEAVGLEIVNEVANELWQMIKPSFDKPEPKQ